jgi:hypothetical protein
MRSDEEGSLIIALAVILVLSGLSLAILARTVSALASARLGQDSAAAESAADTGVTDALYVLDHSTVTGAPMNGGGPSLSYAWTASFAGTPASCAIPAPQSAVCQVGSLESTGTVNGHSRTVHVDVQRTAQWPWVLAASGSLVLDGTDTVASTGGASPVALAAGGQMVLRDGATGGSEQDLLGPGASCTGNGTAAKPASPCNVTATILSADTQLPDPVLPASPPPTVLSSCTGITSLTGSMTSPPVPYLCQGPVSFGPGLVSIGPGQVDLYVEGSGGVPPSVSFAGATIVTTSGSASSFIVHVLGRGVIEPGDGVTASFTGVLDAPQATLRSNPCQFSLTGAADLGSVDCVAGAGPGPALRYDSSLATVYSPTWHITSYGDATS